MTAMTLRLPHEPGYYLAKLRRMHLRIRDHLRDQLEAAAVGELAAVGEQREGDTIFRLDEKGEGVLHEFCEEWAREAPFVLIAEGLPGCGARAFPDGADPQDAAFRMIVDPVDGTRGLMYDKRSAWILTGIAPASGEATLADIEVAMQTEIPTTRQGASDLAFAVKGRGAAAERHGLATGAVRPLRLAPTSAATARYGFATLCKFFVGGKDILARVEEELFETALGAPADGAPLVFDDQYISTGGQLYELACGRDRFVADLRPLAHALAGLTGAAARLCCHPYDLCAELVAREAGVIVTDDTGAPLHAPLNVSHECAWIGYANESIRRELEPTLLGILERLKAGTEPADSRRGS